MRTARSSSRLGGSPAGTPPGPDTPGTRHPPGTRPPQTRPPWDHAPPRPGTHTPGTMHPPDQAHTPQTRHTPLWTESHMPVKQECIPVGCVPPTAVAVGGGLHHAHPPPWTMHLPWTMHTPGPCLPPDHAPPGPCTPPDHAPPSPGPCIPLWTDTRLLTYYLAPNFVCGR